MVDASELENKTIKCFMKNGFVFGGNFLEKKDGFLKILDRKTNLPKFIALSEISEIQEMGWKT